MVIDNRLLWQCKHPLFLTGIEPSATRRYGGGRLQTWPAFVNFICGGCFSCWYWFWSSLLPGKHILLLLLTSIYFFAQAPSETDNVTIGGGGDKQLELQDKPYKCDPPCIYSFTQKGNLLRHQSSRTCYHKRPYFCEICGQRFQTEQSKENYFKKGRCVM